MIVGIAGRKGSGKTTVADGLEDIGFDRLSFASTLKLMARVLMTDCGLNNEQIAHYQQDKEAVMPVIGVSYRHLCQTLGTEWGRQHIHADLWVIAAKDRANKHPVPVVFDDVRFDNEADMIRESGGLIIHLERPGLPADDLHASEHGITYRRGDIRLSNESGVDDLMQAAIDAVRRFGAAGCD